MEPTTQPKKLLDQVRDTLRVKHYAYGTEESYIQWIRRFILFHNKRHPKDMGEAEVEALSALLFLYRHVSNNPSKNPSNQLEPNNPNIYPLF